MSKKRVSIMGPMIGLSSTVVLACLILYNAMVSYQWHQDRRGEKFMAESSYWHSTFFYSNCEDPRLFVPKRSGGGYSINFGKPFAIMLDIFLFSHTDNFFSLGLVSRIPKI